MNTPTEETLFRIVYQALQSFNEQRAPHRKLAPSAKCELVGSPNLDSVDVVNLLVMIEQQVDRDLGLTISLFEGDTVEEGVESFATVEAVVAFLARKIGRTNVED